MIVRRRMCKLRKEISRTEAFGAPPCPWVPEKVASGVSDVGGAVRALAAAMDVSVGLGEAYGKASTTSADRYLVRRGCVS
jgi:hypothetical protein